MHRNRFFVSLLALFLAAQSSIFAFHTTNKYFPFLERPEDFLPKENFSLQVSPFYTTASTAFNHRWGTGKVSELSGYYDLKDVITSLQFVKGPAFTNPIVAETGSTDFVGKKMPFTVTSKIKSVGFSLRAEHFFPETRLTIGGWMPFAWVSTSARYKLNSEYFIKENGFTFTQQSLFNNESTFQTIDKVRRAVHDEIGFTENLSSDFLFGDIDAYIRWNYFLDHQLLMRTINIDVQGGVIIPTGNKRKCSERLNPVWAPLMSNGHWGFYLDVVPQLELKQDLKVGSFFSALFQLSSKKTMRIPTFRESALFSALEDTVNVTPGVTLKVAPFITLNNVTDNLHFHARYNYVRHTTDRLCHDRGATTPPSYLTITPEDFNGIDTVKETITPQLINENIRWKKDLSKWRSHYVSLQGTYDFSPEKDSTHHQIYVLYDMPIAGKNISKTHHVTCGYEVTF